MAQDGQGRCRDCYITKWIVAEHAKRETRKASELRRFEEREAAGEPVAAPAVDRTPRVEQLIRNLATANEVITTRNQ